MSLKLTGRVRILPPEEKRRPVEAPRPASGIPARGLPANGSLWAAQKYVVDYLIAHGVTITPEQMPPNVVWPTRKLSPAEFTEEARKYGPSIIDTSGSLIVSSKAFQPLAISLSLTGIWTF